MKTSVLELDSCDGWACSSVSVIGSCVVAPQSTVWRTSLDVCGTALYAQVEPFGGEALSRDREPARYAGVIQREAYSRRCTFPRSIAPRW